MLKILEEPPSYVVFLFATTDPQKIPATILSRVQRFNFSRISTQGIINRLKYIIEKENLDYFNDTTISQEEYLQRQQAEGLGAEYITYEEEAINYIARLAKGGMRDSITTLEKCLDYSKDLTLANVHIVTSGGVTEQTLLEVLKILLNKDSKQALLKFDEIYMTGIDVSLFLKLYIEFIENCIKYIITKSPDIVPLSEITLSWLNESANFLDEIRSQLMSLLSIRNNYSSEDFKIILESWIIQICNL